jgi:hypothetical protein
MALSRIEQRINTAAATKRTSSRVDYDINASVNHSSVKAVNTSQLDQLQQVTAMNSTATTIMEGIPGNSATA